jgi:hypothetical protein
MPCIICHHDTHVLYINYEIKKNSSRSGSIKVPLLPPAFPLLRLLFLSFDLHLTTEAEQLHPFASPA